MRPYAALGALSLALLIAGCGATKVVTVPSTQTVTRTVVHHTAAPRSSSRSSGASSGGYVESYPTSFAPKFNAKCAQHGNGPGYCSCVVHYIERHVSFYTVLADTRAVFTSHPPSWVASAEDQCFTP